MAYELKEIRINSELLAPKILQAEGSVIYREAVKNGGTFQVPAISQAKVGDILSIWLKTYSTWTEELVLTEVHLGKPLDFNVRDFIFSEGNVAVASYWLRQGEDRFNSPETSYELKD